MVNELRNVADKERYILDALANARLEGLCAGLVCGFLCGVFWREIVRFLVAWW